MRSFQILKLISLMDLMVQTMLKPVHACTCCCKWLYIMCIMFVQDFHSNYSISGNTSALIKCIQTLAIRNKKSIKNAFGVKIWKFWLHFQKKCHRGYFGHMIDLEVKRDRKFFAFKFFLRVNTTEYSCRAIKNISLHNWKNSFEITVLPK